MQPSWSCLATLRRTPPQIEHARSLSNACCHPLQSRELLWWWYVFILYFDYYIAYIFQGAMPQKYRYCRFVYHSQCQANQVHPPKSIPSTKTLPLVNAISVFARMSVMRMRTRRFNWLPFLSFQGVLHQKDRLDCNLLLIFSFPDSEGREFEVECLCCLFTAVQIGDARGHWGKRGFWRRTYR